MIQCLRIFFSIVLPKKLLHNIQKKAKDLKLEGTVQTTYHEQHADLRIVVCGSKQAIADFIDYLHLEITEKVLLPPEIEPFIKDKDFRGVFRIIE